MKLFIKTTKAQFGIATTRTSQTGDIVVNQRLDR
jgi:hypothetical protein